MSYFCSGGKMKQSESGRTLVEMLAILCIIGVFSVSGLNLYAKAMTTVRANYIMKQVFIRANELLESPVSSRSRGKSVDISAPKIEIILHIINNFLLFSFFWIFS